MHVVLLPSLSLVSPYVTQSDDTEFGKFPVGFGDRGRICSESSDDEKNPITWLQSWTIKLNHDVTSDCTTGTSSLAATAQ